MVAARKFGWKRPATPLKGRKAYLTAADVSELPVVVDMLANCALVYDQANQGSCTGQAVAGGIEYLQRRQGLPRWTPSRQALYYAGRKASGTIDDDDGAVLADVIAAANEGVATEALWPYDVKLIATAPSGQYTLASRETRLVNYEPLAHDLPTLLWELSCGYPVAFGADVYAAFEEVGADGIVPLPARGAESIGGHAMGIFGFDRARELFTVRNSWGEAWGEKGYCRFPFAYLTDLSLCGELFAMRAIRSLRLVTPVPAKR